jgi:hypothetical protein
MSAALIVEKSLVLSEHSGLLRLGQMILFR